MLFSWLALLWAQALGVLPWTRAKCLGAMEALRAGALPAGLRQEIILVSGNGHRLFQESACYHPLLSAGVKLCILRARSRVLQESSCLRQALHGSQADCSGEQRRGRTQEQLLGPLCCRETIPKLVGPQACVAWDQLVLQGHCSQEPQTDPSPRQL